MLSPIRYGEITTRNHEEKTCNAVMRCDAGNRANNLIYS